MNRHPRHPHYEREYRIACWIRDFIFGATLLPIAAILFGGFLYELGV